MPSTLTLGFKILWICICPYRSQAQNTFVVNLINEISLLQTPATPPRKCIVWSSQTNSDIFALSQTCHNANGMYSCLHGNLKLQKQRTRQIPYITKHIMWIACILVYATIKKSCKGEVHTFSQRRSECIAWRPFECVLTCLSQRQATKATFTCPV